MSGRGGSAEVNDESLLEPDSEERHSPQEFVADGLEDEANVTDEDVDIDALVEAVQVDERDGERR
jgi:hypothetical protein